MRSFIGHTIVHFQNSRQNGGSAVGPDRQFVAVRIGELEAAAAGEGEDRLDDLAAGRLHAGERVLEIGAELRLKLVDAIHVATAEALGCRTFLTNDRGIRAPVGIALETL